MESLLAAVLEYGSWVASAAIALGLLLATIDSQLGTRIATAGIALFILLPVLRVALMLVLFLRRRDYRFSAIAGLVLAIIFLGYVLGKHMGAVTER